MDTTQRSLRNIFFHWEALRLVFNCVIFFHVMTKTGSSLDDVWRHSPMIVMHALFANGVYSVFPVAECAACVWFGLQTGGSARPLVRLAAFAVVFTLFRYGLYG